MKQKKSKKSEFKVKESPKRSFAKAIVWRILATLITISLVFIFTGKLILSIGIGFIEVILKLILYYFHEQSWSLINWGRTSYRIKRGKKQ